MVVGTNIFDDIPVTSVWLPIVITTESDVGEGVSVIVGEGVAIGETVGVSSGVGVESPPPPQAAITGIPTNIKRDNNTIVTFLIDYPS
jgi:hypothetical protein